MVSKNNLEMRTSGEKFTVVATNIHSDDESDGSICLVCDAQTFEPTPVCSVSGKAFVKAELNI